VNLTKEETALILSALTHDTIGTYGDGREEAIQRLIRKIKRERAKA
jgi:hypothetical protein